jgi:TolA-binding protein
MCLLYPLTQTAQHITTPAIEQPPFEKGIELYKKGQFGLAQKYLDEVAQNYFDVERERRATAAYYAALCAMELYNGDAKARIDDFADQYALSPLVNQLYLTYAHNKFSLRRYRDANEYYGKVNNYRLNKDQVSEYQFKWAYAKLMQEENKEAQKLFFKVKDDKSIYANSAKYYYAHLLYTDSNYTEALTNFLPLQEDENFGPLVPYYLAHIYYRLGEFDKLLEVGESLVESATPSRAPEIAKLMGDAFYTKKDYPNAIKYLELYVEKGGRMRAQDNFQMGYAYYQGQRYAAAVEYFNKITGGDKQLLQSAYYHLADCYLKLNEKSEAQTAFKAASEINASPTVREDAFFNYAKLSYELSDPYGDAITTLNAFMSEFPNSTRINEVNRYLANLYVTTKDYDKALLAIKRTGLDSPEMKGVYQKISFYRATELFNSLQYPEAIIKYSEALDYPINTTITALSMYWRAEGYYRLGNYEKSIEEYEAFRKASGAFAMSEYNTSFYQTGYAHYMLKDYQPAATELRIFAKEADRKDPKLPDAYLRMADAYLLTGGYLVAADFYQSAIKTGNKERDYAYYQRAICLGLASKPEQKIAELKNLINNYANSIYAEDAAFEIAITQLQMEDYNTAITSFQRFMKQYPNAQRSAEAYLNMGLAYRNSNRENEAIEMYRKVVTDYPGSEASIEAISLAKLAYARNNRIDEYIDWVQKLEFVNFDEASLDSTAYNTAFDQYSLGNCGEAIKGFQQYLKRFERGLFMLDANYYLANCAREKKDTAVYIAAYKQILNLPKNQYTAEALQNLAYNAYIHRQYDQARKYYRQWADVAGNKNAQTKANAGLMRTAFKLKDHNEAAIYADLVAGTETSNAELSLEARRIGALSKYQLQRYPEAKEGFTFLRNTSEGEIKAEAMYHLALIQHAEGDYAATKETVNALVSELPAFKEIKMNALLLLARNYWKQDDIFQANYILEFVIKSDFSQKTVQEARDLKVEIEEAERQALLKKKEQMEAQASPINLGEGSELMLIDVPMEELENVEKTDSLQDGN